MSSVNDFIAELVRAANEVHRSNRFETMRMLDRAIIRIWELREAAGIPLSRLGTDSVVDLQTVASLIEAGQASEASIKAALREAAAMLRDLHIVIDTHTEIQFGDRN